MMSVLWLTAYSLQLTAAPAPVPYQSVTVPGFAYEPELRGDLLGCSWWGDDGWFTHVWSRDKGPIILPGRLVLLREDRLLTQDTVGEWDGTASTRFDVWLIADLFPPPEPGDFSDDGWVDMTDFGILQRELGGDDMRYDLTGDGVIDGRDVDAFGRLMR